MLHDARLALGVDAVRYEPAAIEPKGAGEPLRAGLALINPSEWAGVPVPEREWLVPGLIPAKTVTAIYGDGATGKSTLVLQLALARALGQKWIGLDVKPGATLYLSAEDDAKELHRRTEAIRTFYGARYEDIGGLRFADLVGRDSVIGAPDRASAMIKPTRLYTVVREAIVAVGADVLAIDSLADAFSGNELDRQHARQFIGILKRICRELDVTVIVIAHPSVSGMQTGSGTAGNTAWNNSVRSRLYFERPRGNGESDAGNTRDPDLRILTTKKSNYGPQGGEVEVRYVGGAFKEKAAGTVLDRKAKERQADRKFIDLLTIYNEQGQNVSANRGPTYAPTVFAKDHRADLITKDAFANAMQRHLTAKTIRIEETGRASKKRSRLVVSEAAT